MAQLMRNNNIDFSIILFDINKNIRHDMLKQRGLTEAEIEVRLNREDNYDVEEFYNYSIFPDIIYKSLAQDMGEDIVNQLEYLKNEEI
jgi:predicted hydrolase (HD superfamily)